MDQSMSLFQNKGWISFWYLVSTAWHEMMLDALLVPLFRFVSDYVPILLDSDCHSLT